jgi:hypothetical protein
MVAFSTTIGAWLIAHQFGWMWWGEPFAECLAAIARARISHKAN